MKKLLPLIIPTVLLIGCAQNTWYKSTAKAGDFERDRYDCLQQSQQQVSAAQTNGWQGAAVSKAVTNDGLFSSCMNARGWSIQNSQAVQNQIQQQQSNAAAVKSQIDSDKARINAMGVEMCANPELKAYYSKTACKVQDITFEQLADTSKITASQKSALVKQRAIADKIQKEQAKAMRSTPSPNDKKVADLYESIIVTQGNQINLDLYNGKITWGEFNQKRKDVLSKYQAAVKAATGK